MVVVVYIISYIGLVIYLFFFLNVFVVQNADLRKREDGGHQVAGRAQGVAFVCCCVT